MGADHLEAKKTFDVIFAADKSAAQGGVPTKVSS
jgi:hypothetical protein